MKQPYKTNESNAVVTHTAQILNNTQVINTHKSALNEYKQFMEK